MRMVRSLLCLLALVATSWPAAATPKVLVSIKPVHSLVAAVMQGAGAPDLLIDGAASAHAYALKPSDARKIASADLIFIVGGGLENYLDAPLHNLSRAELVALSMVPGVKRLEARRGGLWNQAHADGHDHDGDGHDGHDHGHLTFDPHMWLDPMNAVAMVRAIARTLQTADPAHGSLYQANAAREIAMLDGLDRALRAQLAPVRGRGYLVFHDAYAYFEARYGLKSLGAVTIAPDRPVGPHRIGELRRQIAAKGAHCLFREPQFPPKLIATLTEGSTIRVGVLDPLGASLANGPDLYPALLRGLADSLRRCLDDKKR